LESKGNEPIALNLEVREPGALLHCENLAGGFGPEHDFGKVQNANGRIRRKGCDVIVNADRLNSTSRGLGATLRRQRGGNNAWVGGSRQRLEPGIGRDIDRCPERRRHDRKDIVGAAVQPKAEPERCAVRAGGMGHAQLANLG
jgi:hypothetical protein